MYLKKITNLVSRFPISRYVAGRKSTHTYWWYISCTGCSYNIESEEITLLECEERKLQDDWSYLSSSWCCTCRWFVTSVKTHKFAMTPNCVITFECAILEHTSFPLISLTTKYSLLISDNIKSWKFGQHWCVVYSNHEIKPRETNLNVTGHDGE